MLSPRRPLLLVFALLAILLGAPTALAEEPPPGVETPPPPPPAPPAGAIPAAAPGTPLPTLHPGRRIDRQGPPLPSALGLDATEADHALRGWKVRRELVVGEPDDAGLVVRQVPEPGTPLAEGESVTLVFALTRPPTPDHIATPSCLDTTAGQAVNQVRAAGLVPGLRSVPSDAEASGRVVAQSPLPGSLVTPGEQVLLFVGAGGPRPAPQVVTLPPAAPVPPTQPGVASLPQPAPAPTPRPAPVHVPAPPPPPPEPAPVPRPAPAPRPVPAPAPAPRPVPVQVPAPPPPPQPAPRPAPKPAPVPPPVRPPEPAPAPTPVQVRPPEPRPAPQPSVSPRPQPVPPVAPAPVETPPPRPAPPPPPTPGPVRAPAPVPVPAPAVTALATPRLVSPPEGQSFPRAFGATFQWTMVSGAKAYELVLEVEERDGTFSEVWSERVSATRYRPERMESGRFRWRVRAVTDEVEGPWSPYLRLYMY